MNLNNFQFVSLNSIAMMTRMLCCFAILLSGECLAITFVDNSERSDWFFGTGITDIEINDLDGDGDKDVIIAVSTGKNKIWLNNGDGVLSDSGQSFGNSSSNGIATGDLDGDGDLDIFAANSRSDHVFFKNGSGFFVDSGQELGNSYSSNVELADLDNDGDLDAYVTANNEGFDQIWWNDGKGNFGNISKSSGKFFQYSSGLILSDLNNDGFIDATTTNNSPKIIMRLNEGKGEFAEVDLETMLGLPSLGDIDNDGDLDLFVSKTGAGDELFFNDGFGNFENSGQLLGHSHAPIGGPLQSTDVTLADVDGDGDLDAFNVNIDWVKSGIWINDGIGNFSDEGKVFPIRRLKSGQLVDLDGDNDLDAFVRVRDQVYGVWENDGFGEFKDSGQLIGPTHSLDVVVGDLDGDGDLDMFEANAFNGNRVWLNDGKSGFVDSKQVLGNSFSRDVALGDMDGDGDLDVFVANGRDEGETNRIWLNNGSAKFTDSGQLLGNSLSLNVSLGDLDGDGDLDAYVTNDGHDQIWINDGLAGLSKKVQETTENTNSTDVALADLDSDGDTDIFLTSYSASGQVWLNDGSGNFSDSNQLLGILSNLKIALEDLDGDGDLDVFAANLEANTVWFNNGKGLFTNSGQELGNYYSTDVALSDLDNDGDIDAFVTNDKGTKIWLNDGKGSFEASELQLTIPFGHGQNAVALGDFDGNGKIDAIVASNKTNRVWLSFEPSLVQFNASSYIVNEIDGSATVSVSRTGSGNGGVSVNYITRPHLEGISPAIIPTDYTISSGTLSWDDGELGEKNFEVSVIYNPAAEKDKTIKIELNKPVGIKIGDQNSVVLTILDSNALNNSPVSNAGLDQTVNENVKVTLYGNGDDSDGAITAYNWSQVSGPSVELTKVDIRNATFTTPITLNPVDLTFRLIVTDNNNGSSSDDIVIKVIPTPSPTQSQNAKASIEDSSSKGAVNPLWLLLLVITIIQKTKSKRPFSAETSH